MSEKVKVYIDGQEGTTGLKILERFQGRDDIELIRISEDKRKDPAERARLINSADYVFLCLPDDASRLFHSWITTMYASSTLPLHTVPIRTGLTVSRSFPPSTVPG